MEDFLVDIFGQGRDLTALQICVRAFLMFFIALLLVRLGGIRIFGKKSAFDDIVSVVLGAILSRGVTGAAPFGGVVAAGLVLVATHRVVALWCIRSARFETLMKGKQMVLYEKGRINHKNMLRCSLSRNDLLESLRLTTQKESLDEIEKAYMENNGNISFIEKKTEN
jgi:uncharacterized membrane protein YcaP (DUF421 family)